MTALAIEDIAYFKLNTYEIERTEKSYSYQTIRHFKEKYPEHEFYFIIGADSLLKIETWVRPDLIIQSVIILAAYRDDMDTPEEMYQQIDYLNEKYDGDIRLLRTPLLDVSSHEIREEILKGHSKSLLLPDKVLGYIREKNLYTRE